MKKYIIIAAFCIVVVIIPVIIVSQMLISPVGIIEDVVKVVGDVKFTNGYAYNDVTVMLANYFEYGYADLSYEKYFDDKVIDETKHLKNYYMIPCLLAGISEPSQSLIDNMTEAMIEVIEEEYEDEETGEIIIIEKINVLDAHKYATRLKRLNEFSDRNLPISANTLAGYIDMFASLNNNFGFNPEWGEDMPGMSDDYIDFIGDGWGYPFSDYYRVTAFPGIYKPFDKWENHFGTDFGAPGGTPIYAVRSGTVIAKNDPTCRQGCFVKTLTDDGKLTVEYWHMATPWVGNIGDHIELGDYIGPVGKTGYATGNHLHLEIRVYANKEVISYCDMVDCNNPPLP